MVKGILISFLAGCAPPAAPSDSPEAAETTWIQDISVSPAEAVPTTLAVSFNSPTIDAAWIAYRIDDGPWLQTPPTIDESNHILPVVAGPLVDLELQVVIEIDGEQHESGIFTAQSGGLLPNTPVLTITENNYTPPDGELLLLSVFGDVVHTVMLSFDGEILWALPQGDPDATLLGGLSVEPSVLHQGQLLFNSFVPDDWENTQAEIWRVNLLGEVQERTPTPYAHHFFTQTPDGDLIWLRTDIREQDNLEIVGDEVVRTSHTTGETTSFLSLWDTLSMPMETPPGGRFDWTHANWVGYTASRDSYLVSTALANFILEVSPEGEVLRTINGFNAAGNAYVYDDITAAFYYPHGPHWTRDGEDLLVFSTREHASHAARFSFSDDDRTLSRTWEHGLEEHREAMLLGEVQELSDGNILIGWGGLGVLQVVTPEGEVLWEAQTGLGSFFSQVQVIPDPYSTLVR